MDELNPRSINRDELQTFLPTTKLIRAFESLFKIGAQTPDAINELITQVSSLQEDSDSARVAATAALAGYGMALALAQQANDGPPPMLAPLLEQVEDLTQRLCAAEAANQTLASRLAAFEDGPKP